MYTKGKWIARINDIGIDVIEEKSGFGIVDIGNEKSLSDCEYPIEEAKANAKLISAAPEMFEALKRVEAYLVANEDVLAPFPTRSELDNIRAAMFKTGMYQYGG